MDSEIRVGQLYSDSPSSPITYIVLSRDNKYNKMLKILLILEEKGYTSRCGRIERLSAAILYACDRLLSEGE